MSAEPLHLVPEIAEIRARRQERYDLVHRDPAGWAHLADDATRLLRDHGDRYDPHAQTVLRALAWAAREVSRWRPTTEGPSRPSRRGRSPILHGTEAGYHQHVYQRRTDPGHVVCQDCREAHAAHESARRSATPRGEP